jgi:hypothetical protein
MATGFLLILLIILSAVLALLCSIFSIIYFANSKKGKFGWLGGFLASLLVLIASIFYTVNTVASKAKNFAHKMEESFIRSIDTAAYNNYNFADSLNSPQLKYLKLIEPKDLKQAIPAQFYNYLGFRDYYRMPLRYPFSIHCTDALDNGQLFNEKEVEKFDESNNGEIDCQVTGIQEFVFDEHFLIARQTFPTERKEISSYIIYNFDNEKSEKIASLDALIARAQTLGFSRPLKFVSCKDYYGLL